jgi:hypothetical protein
MTLRAFVRLFRGPSHASKRQRRAASRPVKTLAFRPRLEALEDRTLLSVSAISIATSGTQMGNNSSSAAIGLFSANGRYDVFTSRATNLVNGISISGGNHVYLRNLSTGTTSLVDVATNGTTSGNDQGIAPSITPDGRYVAFLSGADNLTNNDQNPARSEIYVRDTSAGQTFLVSLGTDGKPGNSLVDGTPSIAEDGQSNLLVAYASRATNLTSGDSNSNYDQVFVTTFTLDAGGDIQYSSLNTTLVSADNTSTGNGGNGDSVNPLLSQDGSTLDFTSKAANLNVPGGYSNNNTALNLYQYSLATQTLSLISAEPTPDGVTTTAATGNDPSKIRYNGLSAADRLDSIYQESLSSNGQFAVFTSTSDNMVPGATINKGRNVYLRDLVNGSTSLVSISRDGTGGGNADNPVVTPDGRYVAFQSDARNLTSRDIGSTQVYVRDMQQGQTYLVSLGIDGNLANKGDFLTSSIAETSNGQLVIAYRTNSTNLTANDTNSSNDQVFVTTFNLDGSGNIQEDTRTTQLASATSTGNGGNGASDDAILSKDGSTLAIASFASNLPGETADNADGRIHTQISTFNLASGTLTQVSPAPPSGDTADSTKLSSLSDNGQYLAYIYQNVQTGFTEVLAWNAYTGTNSVIDTSTQDAHPLLTQPVISGDGSTIAFRAGNVDGRAVIRATNDWQSGNPTLRQVSPDLSTYVFSGQNPSISDNGQVIAYQLTPSGFPNQVYVWNNGTITEVSAAVSGGGSNGISDTPEVSADGSTVLFNSAANNLLTGVINFGVGQSNVYAYNVGTRAVSLVVIVHRSRLPSRSLIDSPAA